MVPDERIDGNHFYARVEEGLDLLRVVADKVHFGDGEVFEDGHGRAVIPAVRRLAESGEGLAGG